MTVFLFSPQRNSEDWQPAADVYRSPFGWILKFDLAGVRMSDVHVHVGKRSITLSGIRRDLLTEEAGCCHYSMEISYSRFERTIALPDDLTEAKFRLDYRDGILFVRISVHSDKEQE